jgi:hypothetical protein
VTFGSARTASSSDRSRFMRLRGFSNSIGLLTLVSSPQYLSSNLSCLSADLILMPQDTFHVQRLEFGRCLPLRHELMALIDCGDPTDRTALVVQDLVGHMWRNLEPGHTCRHRTAKVVQNPVHYA